MKLKKNMSAVGHHTSHPTKLSQHLAVDNCTDTKDLPEYFLTRNHSGIFMCLDLHFLFLIPFHRN